MFALTGVRAPSFTRLEPVRLFGAGLAACVWVASAAAAPLLARPERPSTGTPTATPRTGITVPVPARSHTSPIWSGYVVRSSGPLVTEASGTWTVPALDCSVTPNGGASTWVGIGGVTWKTGATSGSLLQTGVRTQCLGGRQRDAGWFELYPSKPNESADFAGFPASPGDSIKASVYRASGRAWVTRLDDLTAGISGWMVTGEGWGVARDRGNGRFSGQGATDGLSYAGGYTAEWIVEDYSENGSRVPLADYGAVTFAHLTTSLRSWSLTPGDAETMAQDGVVLSTPSPPSGNGFSVTSTRGASTLPAHAREAR